MKVENLKNHLTSLLINERFEDVLIQFEGSLRPDSPLQDDLRSQKTAFHNMNVELQNGTMNQTEYAQRITRMRYGIFRIMDKLENKDLLQTPLNELKETAYSPESLTSETNNLKEHTTILFQLLNELQAQNSPTNESQKTNLKKELDQVQQALLRIRGLI